MRAGRHLLFWTLVTLFLTITFGQADGDYTKSFLFVTFLLPAAMGTSYFFNYYLVPNYLLKKRYFKFGLYLLYTLIFSLYLEMIALLLALILLANYRYQNLNPYVTNLWLLTGTLYLIVFINAFVLLLKRYQNKEHLLDRLHEKQEKEQLETIVVRADRKNHPVTLEDIYYLESLADYVKIHTVKGQIITREKISEFESNLPTTFIRVHRSFIVNTAHVQSFSSETLTVNDETIPLSRTYKKKVLENFKTG